MDGSPVRIHQAFRLPGRGTDPGILLPLFPTEMVRNRTVRNAASARTRCFSVKLTLRLIHRTLMHDRSSVQLMIDLPGRCANLQVCFFTWACERPRICEAFILILVIILYHKPHRSVSIHLVSFGPFRKKPSSPKSGNDCVFRKSDLINSFPVPSYNRGLCCIDEQQNAD